MQLYAALITVNSGLVQFAKSILLLEMAAASRTPRGTKPMYRPLIYTTCYGHQCYFDCLWLMLKSLYVFGHYRGGILVLTDRAEPQVRVPDEVTDMVRIICCDVVDQSTRFTINEFLGDCDTPALYMDSDIVVTQDVDPILRKMSATRGIYVGSESTLQPEFANIPPSAITNQYANWFGLDLFLDDGELREHPLECLNSGLFGFSERRLFEQPGSQIHEMFRCDRWSRIAAVYGDQPFFNYVLAKLEKIDSGLLSGSLSFVTNAEQAVELPRPFVHFAWAKGDDKAVQMSKYLSFLESSRSHQQT